MFYTPYESFCELKNKRLSNENIFFKDGYYLDLSILKYHSIKKAEILFLLDIQYMKEKSIECQEQYISMKIGVNIIA